MNSPHEGKSNRTAKKGVSYALAESIKHKLLESK